MTANTMARQTIIETLTSRFLDSTKSNTNIKILHLKKTLFWNKRIKVFEWQKNSYERAFHIANCMLSLPEDDYHLVSNTSITSVVGARERPHSKVALEVGNCCWKMVAEQVKT